MKKFFLIICQFFLLILFVYIISVDNIPDNIILFNTEDLNIKTVAGITLKKYNEETEGYETIQAANNFSSQIGEEDNKIDLQVSLFDKIFLKKVSVNVIEETKVIPLGNTIGLKLYTAGVLVVGTSESEQYKKSELEEGDLIVAVNSTEVTSTTELMAEIKEANGDEVKVDYIRKGEKHTANIKPVKLDNNEYKLGLWVRDSAAGVGTISFYEPSTGMFVALGHGITDVDTGELITIAKGNVVTTNIVSLVRGEKGKPGEMKGSILNQPTIGEISRNTKFGIFGKLTNLGVINANKKEIPVASRDEIKEGEAKILCALDENGKKPQEYKIQIETIYTNNNEDNKSMVIKVTDEKLIEKTGGIIQGMSGSPIIQNNKLIGVVTHVFVSHPTMGYAVFADLLIKEMREA